MRDGISCDIFCRVVDNFGDIGVCWRLARQLASEYGLVVRLVVDDLVAFNLIEPAVDISIREQLVCGVTVIGWELAATVTPARLVVEAFAVNLPAPYVAKMSELAAPPVWVNLEYLSAEPWVGEHHLLPSPHPRLPLTKFFFFPGFTARTGGLIREAGLVSQQGSYISSDGGDGLRIFLFGYPNVATENLLRALSDAGTPIRCTVPEGAPVMHHAQGIGLTARAIPNLIVSTIPFVSQRDFDRLLWGHDVLFVRGEDSFIRAQWAAKPFIWQIYPQEGGAHWAKLDAFLGLYTEGLERDPSSALRQFWRAWNAEDAASIGAAWMAFAQYLPELRAHAIAWSKKLAQMPDLAANLLSFYQKTIKI